jgi:aspartyl-tRNA synthetase
LFAFKRISRFAKEQKIIRDVIPFPRTPGNADFLATYPGHMKLLRLSWHFTKKPARKDIRAPIR